MMHTVTDWEFGALPDLPCFSHLQVRLLKRYPGLKIGSHVWLQPMPHGQLYLGLPDAFNTIFATDVHPGVEFEFVFPTLFMPADGSEQLLTLSVSKP